MQLLQMERDSTTDLLRMIHIRGRTTSTTPQNTGMLYRRYLVHQLILSRNNKSLPSSSLWQAGPVGGLWWVYYLDVNIFITLPNVPHFCLMHVKLVAQKMLFEFYMTLFLDSHTNATNNTNYLKLLTIPTFQTSTR